MIKKRRLPGSIFIKLILIFLATGIAVNSLIYMTGTLFSPMSRREFIDRNLYLYLGRLADEIGPLPTQERIDRITRETGLAVRVNTPKQTLQTEVGLPDPTLSMSPQRKMNENVKSPGPRPYFIIRRGDINYTFYGPTSEAYYGRPEPFFLAILTVSLVLAVSYFALRKVLRPVRDLMEAVVSVGSGRFNHHVKVNGRDELADLAQLFNEMTTKINAMIQAKERLLIDVSHELRSPITRMKVAVKLIGDEKGRERIHRDLVNMERMVSILLESARFERHDAVLHRQSFDLGELIEECARDCADRKPGVLVIPLLRRTKIEADRAGLYAVIKNLLDNGLKYSSNQDQSVEVKVTDRGASYDIDVRDYGIGIPADQIDKIFEPFYRIDPSRSKESGGFGLGLNLCLRVVQAHGGSIHAYSSAQISPGTMFRVVLPKLVPLVDRNLKTERLNTGLNHQLNSALKV